MNGPSNSVMRCTSKSPILATCMISPPFALAVNLPRCGGAVDSATAEGATRSGRRLVGATHAGLTGATDALTRIFGQKHEPARAIR
jgi:hypothetical protein